MLIVLVSVFGFTIKTLNTSLTRYLLSLSPQHPLGLEKMSLRSGLPSRKQLQRLYSKTSIQGKFLGQEKVALVEWSFFNQIKRLLCCRRIFFQFGPTFAVLNKKFQTRNFQRQRFVPSVAAQTSEGEVSLLFTT